jgi:hypothetical protein
VTVPDWLKEIVEKQKAEKKQFGIVSESENIAPSEKSNEEKEIDKTLEKESISDWTTTTTSIADGPAVKQKMPFAKATNGMAQQNGQTQPQLARTFGGTFGRNKIQREEKEIHKTLEKESISDWATNSIADEPAVKQKMPFAKATNGMAQKNGQTQPQMARTFGGTFGRNKIQRWTLEMMDAEAEKEKTGDNGMAMSTEQNVHDVQIHQQWGSISGWTDVPVPE